MKLLMFMLHSVILLLPQDFVKTSNALKLPLIHPNSPESPLYVANLTRQQRIEYLVRHSTNRARRISSRSYINFTNLAVMSPEEIYVKGGSLLLVKLGVGTFQSAISYRTFYFHMDTGTDQTWVQCEDCVHYEGCFGNPPIYFRNSRSSSYHPLPCDSHELCYQGECVDGYCSYRVVYPLDHSEAEGILAYESFTFGTGRDRAGEDNFNLVFGCNRVWKGPLVTTEENGMLGLMWGRRSLIDQLTNQGHIHDSFSTCFPHYDDTALGSIGYLELGTEGDFNDDYSSTPLHRYGEVISLYYLNLEGISVAQTRLHIDPHIFARAYNQGGSIIDSGCMVSYIAVGAHTILTRTLHAYFSNLGNYKRVKPRRTDYQFGLCYRDLERREGLLPSMTLHYSGADLELEPDNVFMYLTPERDVFCMAIHPAYEGMSILGAYQQSNFKFVYDRARMLLHFKTEYCHQGA